jgi:osmotically-inducible protein OsmY
MSIANERTENHPKSYQDEHVCRQVQDFLRSRNFPVFRTLDVEVDCGSVTLTGTVSSYYEKQIAITVGSQVAGVLALVDQIDVADYLILGQL